VGRRVDGTGRSIRTDTESERPIAAAAGATPIRVIEPHQQRERRVALTRPGAVQYVQIVYHEPPCTHLDFAALLLLDAVLSGAKRISFSHGAVTHQSARLSAALVETGLASTASSHYYATRDPWLFELYATVDQGATPAAVERALVREIAHIQQEGVTRAEVARARKQIQAQLAYAREGVRSQAWLLGLWATLDQFTGVETLLSVTEGDIQRVAQTYLTAQNRTVGHLLASPREQAVGDSAPE
jgi:zinc protease